MMSTAAARRDVSRPVTGAAALVRPQAGVPSLAIVGMVLVLVLTVLALAARLPSG